MTVAMEGTRSGEKQRRQVFGTSAGVPDGEHASDIIETGSPGLSYLNPRLVKKLRTQLRAQTAECVMETFGISVRTWMKMRDGMPVRRSVAERLVQRVGANL